LPERWEQLLAEQPHIHPRRPEAYQILTTLFWTQLFESYDPEVTNFPIETRHPLFDLRLLSYLMALPTLPVCVDKRLMRMAMRGMLPEQVLSRRKAPLTGDPLVEVMRRNGFYTKNPLRLAPELAAYVRFDWIPRLTDTTQGADQLWANLRVLSLNYWLCGLIRTSSKSTFLKGDVYGTEEATPQERISTPSTDCLR
jgi:asparagine synthase (glutamine-hydrolysing)